MTFSIAKVMNTPLAYFAAGSAVSYGVAYAGRSYIALSPTKFALFTLCALVASNAGKAAIKLNLGGQWYNTRSGRLATYLVRIIPIVTFVATRQFSLQQAILATGLMGLTNGAIFTITRRHPAYLFS